LSPSSTAPSPAANATGRWTVVAGVVGAAAVGLGAFGAHALSARFAAGPDGATYEGWWETAAHYHLVHAVALGLAARVAPTSTAGRVAPVCFAVGMLVFSGTLYAMALGAPRWLGAVTPLGGLSLIVGWIALAVAAASSRGAAGDGGGPPVRGQ